MNFRSINSAARTAITAGNTNELLQRKKEFAARFGILLGTRIRVQLVGELVPLEGVISFAERKKPKKQSQLKLSTGHRSHRTFALAQIEITGRLRQSKTPLLTAAATPVKKLVGCLLKIHRRHKAK